MVYIFAVDGVKSGGPELLHQLCFVLNTMGVPSKMVYVANRFPLEVIKTDILEEYRDYCQQTEWDMSIIDQPENTVVVPEIMFEVLDEVSKAVKVAWWLSVDGYKQVLEQKYCYTKEQLEEHAFLDHHHFKKRNDIFHLAQSFYAIDFLKHKIEVPEEQIDYLSDYINDVYFQTDVASLNIERKNMVIFNPKKGGWRLKKIIDETGNEILWVPLENLTKEKMRLHMMLAKVYVDFGNHPGKDRIPREAAVSGCCVITGRRGAAAFEGDVPIPERYKIDDSKDVDVSLVRSLILDIFEHYEERTKEFDSYREMIRGEKEKFVMDVMRLFR